MVLRRKSSFHPNIALILLDSTKDDSKEQVKIKLQTVENTIDIWHLYLFHKCIEMSYSVHSTYRSDVFVYLAYKLNVSCTSWHSYSLECCCILILLINQFFHLSQMKNCYFNILSFFHNFWRFFCVFFSPKILHLSNTWFYNQNTYTTAISAHQSQL